MRRYNHGGARFSQQPFLLTVIIVIVVIQTRIDKVTASGSMRKSIITTDLECWSINTYK